ncbi:hypothetical protein SLA2020_269080 [Shorea laevis]
MGSLYYSLSPTHFLASDILNFSTLLTLFVPECTLSPPSHSILPDLGLPSLAHVHESVTALIVVYLPPRSRVPMPPPRTVREYLGCEMRAYGPHPATSGSMAFRSPLTRLSSMSPLCVFFDMSYVSYDSRRDKYYLFCCAFDLSSFSFLLCQMFVCHSSPCVLCAAYVAEGWLVCVLCGMMRDILTNLRTCIVARTQWQEGSYS